MEIKSVQQESSCLTLSGFPFLRVRKPEMPHWEKTSFHILTYPKSDATLSSASWWRNSKYKEHKECKMLIPQHATCCNLAFARLAFFYWANERKAIFFQVFHMLLSLPGWIEGWSFILCISQFIVQLILDFQNNFISVSMMALWWWLWRLFLSWILMFVQIAKSGQTRPIQLPWMARRLLTMQMQLALLEFLQNVISDVQCWFFFSFEGRQGKEETEGEGVKTGWNFEKEKIRETTSDEYPVWSVSGIISMARYVCQTGKEPERKRVNQNIKNPRFAQWVGGRGRFQTSGTLPWRMSKTKPISFCEISCFTWSQDAGEISLLGYCFNVDRLLVDSEENKKVSWNRLLWNSGSPSVQLLHPMILNMN